MDIFDNIFQDNMVEKNKMIGIITGIVKQVYDEGFPGKIKVSMFMTEEEVNVTEWVRVIVPYAGNNQGMYFMPEVGDEVVIAFERGDIERPFVIGYLWNSKNKVPEGAPADQSTIKTIKTKSGHEITFDDTESKKKIKIVTGKQNEIIMDDENESITISKSNNIMKIDGKKGEITLNSQTKISLICGQSSITIDNSGDISIKAANSISLEGTTVKIKANVTCDIEASATASLKSTGNLEIKGTLVKIN